MQPNFRSQEKNQELLLPAASDCAWSRAIAKDRRRRLDEERLAGFNQSADLPLIQERFLSELPEPPLDITKLWIKLNSFDRKC
jgi:hypothetical protein